MLKSYIKVSTRHLRDVQEMIALAVDNQDSEIKMNKSTEANLPPCTNSFTTTMGLPCAHFILNITQNSINGKLTMEDFHRQWWIDDSVDIPENEVQEGQNGHGDIQIVMDRLLNRYNQWPLPQQLQARQRLTEMAFGPSPLIHDPVIRRGRGRPVGSTARHTTSSTQRDPSSFEIVERTERHCGRCRQPGHTVRTCPN
ncbi:hypothetical protein BC941DRAFT_486267 [Chlamydoabsidia padenii]|nr:hypothetical protein BC941DRAFT_486267 [Chlamydoabsidia padenii]